MLRVYGHRNVFRGKFLSVKLYLHTFPCSSFKDHKRRYAHVEVWLDPPLSPGVPLLPATRMPGGPAVETVLTSPQQPLKALRCRTQPDEVRGRAFGLPAQIGSLCNRKRIALPGPASSVSREIKKRNRLPETEKFHLGLKFCFQVHGGGEEGGG